MIVLDTETTRKKSADASPLEQQPEIIELAMVKLDDETLEECDCYSSLFKPRLPISPECTKITGVTDDMVKISPSFTRELSSIRSFILGERLLVAHNLSFDVDMIAFELRRLGYETRFPWPPEHIDTVELTMDLPAPRQRSARLKLGELYHFCTGTDMPVAHRALDDARALVVCVRHLRALDGRI